MPTEAATLKPLQEFGPSTVYVHGALMSFIGYRSYHASRVSLREMRHAQYSHAILVTLLPRGKRKERCYIETSRPSTVIVDGWVDEQLPGPHGADGAARFAGFDEGWDHEFGAWLEAMCRGSGRKILADLRGHDAQPHVASTAAQPNLPVSLAPASPAPAPIPVTRYIEGAATEIVQTRYERDRAARAACLAHHGLACHACGFDFEQRFGALGAGFIHVHHLEQLADSAQEHAVDPIKDLRPVCPNCHAMLHRRRPPLAIEELHALMRLQ